VYFQLSLRVRISGSSGGLSLLQSVLGLPTRSELRNSTRTTQIVSKCRCAFATESPAHTMQIFT
jgi:hypothetical protein